MKVVYQTMLVASILLTGIQTLSMAQNVLVQTDKGDITIRLNPEKAPVTCENFLKYVDKKRYEGANFYRVVRLDNQPNNKIKIEVIQGGVKDDTTKNLPPIIHENTKITGLRHMEGTISMARMGPGTASSEFFICLNNQPELDFGGKRNPDGQGFAAFGQVVSGMEVVRKIQRGQTGPDNASQSLNQPVKITLVRRLK